jgi:hypothetical protein
VTIKCQITFAWSLGAWIPTAPEGRALPTWLGSDVGCGNECVDWFVAELSRIERGEPKPPPLEGEYVNPNNNYIGTGNSFSVFSSTELFYLEQFVGEDPRLLMTLSQIRDALANYIKVLAHGWRDENDPPAPFAFEFIAEGEDAYRLAEEAGLFSVKH